MQTLNVENVAAVEMPEPAICEIKLELDGGDTAVVRINVFHLQELVAKARPLIGG